MLLAWSVSDHSPASGDRGERLRLARRPPHAQPGNGHQRADGGEPGADDDRGDPVIQLAPPLVCGESHFAEMEQILRSVLTEAWKHI